MNDEQPDMGVTGNVTPDEPLMHLYELDFAMLRTIVEGGNLDHPLKVDAKIFAFAAREG